MRNGINIDQSADQMRAGKYNCYQIKDMRGNLLAELKEKERDIESSIEQFKHDLETFAGYGRVVAFCGKELGESANWNGAKRWEIELQPATGYQPMPGGNMPMGATNANFNNNYVSREVMEMRLELAKMEMRMQQGNTQGKSELEKYIPSRYLDLGIAKALGLDPATTVQLMTMGNNTGTPPATLGNHPGAPPNRVPPVTGVFMTEEGAQSSRPAAGGTTVTQQNVPAWTDENITQLETIIPEITNQLPYENFAEVLTIVKESPNLITPDFIKLLRAVQANPGIIQIALAQLNPTT